MYMYYMCVYYTIYIRYVYLLCIINLETKRKLRLKVKVIQDNLEKIIKHMQLKKISNAFRKRIHK